MIDEAVSIILSREKIHNLWELDALVYSAAAIGVERCRKRDSRKAQINVIEQISNQISDSRKLLSRLTEEIRRQHLNRCLTKKLRYNRRLFHRLSFLFHEETNERTRTAFGKIACSNSQATKRQRPTEVED